MPLQPGDVPKTYADISEIKNDFDLNDVNVYVFPMA